MHKLDNLSADEQAKVENKLEELHEKTSQAWGYEITRRPEADNQLALLEIAVDGRIAKPVVLEENGTNPADRICSELDSLFLRRQSGS